MQKLLLLLLAPRLAWLYIHFVALTSRVRWFNLEARREGEKAYGNFIYAFWHGRQVLLTWAYRGTGHTVLVSQSKDGELIARVLDLFGMRTIRGSSSRGGARSWVELKHAVEGGRTVAFTPDGPRGPQRMVAPGVIQLALKTGKPILPLTCSFRRKLVFRGWDEYWVPLPFNRVEIGLGRFVWVKPGDDLDAKARELAAELDRLTDRADALVAGAEPSEDRAGSAA